MRHAISGAGLFWLAGMLASGQPADPKLEFEVATVKPWVPPSGPGGRGMMLGMRGGPGTPDPGQITYSGLPLFMILSNAYDVRPYQITGPDWLKSERFDIVAKVPPGTTKEQSHVMLQNLLADRFGLKLHHESEDSQVYELVVGKGGPKLAETALPADAAPPKPDAGTPLPAPPKLDKAGFPMLDRPGLIMMMTMGPNGLRSRMVAKAQTLEEVAKALGNQVNRPVVDKTGLTGKYDFNLEFSFEPGSGPMGLPALGLPPGGPPGADGPRLAGAGGGPVPAGGGAAPAGGPVTAPPEAQLDSAPTIFTAIQQQLGLKLESKRAPLDMLVIDHIEKTPTEN